MNDKTAQYAKLIKKNIDRIIIGVMYALLFVLVYLWMSEQTLEVPGGGDETKTIEDTVVKNPAYKKVEKMSNPQTIESNPTIWQVSRFNMFDYKSVKEREKIEQEANQRIAQVEALLKEKRTADAKRLLEEVLKVIPAHAKARNMLEELNKESAPAAAAGTPVPGSTPAL